MKAGKRTSYLLAGIVCITVAIAAVVLGLLGFFAPSLPPDGPRARFQAGDDYRTGEFVDDGLLRPEYRAGATPTGVFGLLPTRATVSERLSREE